MKIKTLLFHDKTFENMKSQRQQKQNTTTTTAIILSVCKQSDFLCKVKELR